jgi:hypothetical protein
MSETKSVENAKDYGVEDAKDQKITYVHHENCGRLHKHTTKLLVKIACSRYKIFKYSLYPMKFV